ncbi:MAG: hypothetical protein LBF55_08055 [Prevotellaceae bacterium]|jgi:hypothetical protein|nr:hypothetical protein [Prevotellaceae bacterium]
MKYKLHTAFFSLAACCLSFQGAAAQDDLYFSPKRQRELDRQQAERRANEASIFGLKRGYEQEPQPQNDSYSESWGDVDSLGTHPNSKIYELRRSDESYGSEREEDDSYAARLRYDDPTYIVYARDPYWYDTWWRYPYAGFYGTWYDRWGWGLGWGYPYYGYGWGHGYGWGYPYYHHYWGYYPSYYWRGHHAHYANVTYGQRTGSMSGTNRGTGYTSSRGSTGGRLAVPNNGMSYRGVQGRGSSSSAAASQPSVQVPQQQESKAATTYRRIVGSGGSTATPTEQRSSTRSSGSSSSYSAPSRSSSSSSGGSYGGSSRSSSSSGGGSRGSSSGRR